MRTCGWTAAEPRRRQPCQAGRYVTPSWAAGSSGCGIPGGDRTALSGPADGHSADREGQRIPTYEDVLELEQDAIAAAGYEEKGGLACIYVETGEDALGYVEKYWAPVDSGLLVCAEQWKGKKPTYRMTSYAVSTDRTLFGLTEFALPDGTVLHTERKNGRPAGGWLPVIPAPAAGAAPG